MGRVRTGAAIKRRGAWVASVELHREPRGPNGRFPRAEVRVRHPDGKPITEAFARAFARALQTRYDTGAWSPDRAPATTPQDASATLGAWVDEWLQTQTYAEAARDRKRSALWLARTKFDALPLSELTPQKVAELLAAVRAHTPTPAPRTVRNVADPIARACRHAVFLGKLTADPWASLPTAIRPHAEDANPEELSTRRMSRAEIVTLLGEPSIEDRWAVLWWILVLTGARISEAIGLRWSDIEDDQPLPRVKIASQIHARTRERTQTKTGAAKLVPLHPQLAEVLAWWRAEGYTKDYGEKPLPGGLIVPARAQDGRPSGPVGAGGPLWYQDAYRAFQRDATACGLGDRSPHDLRHTFVSLCADSGVDGYVAERWTHAPSGGSARGRYLAPSWEKQCEELSKIRLRILRGRWRCSG